MTATTTTRQITLSNAEIAILNTWYWDIRTGMCSVAARVPNITNLSVKKCQEIVDGLVIKGLMEKNAFGGFGIVAKHYHRVCAEHRRIWQDGYMTALSEFGVNNPSNRSDWWDFTIVVAIAE